MQLPKLFYGLYREVKPRLSKVVTQLRRGRPLVPLVEAEGLLDTETTPGLIVFQGPSLCPLAASASSSTAQSSICTEPAL